MRGSVVFLAVFAVTSCSVGVNGAHFVKSGITGYGGNEEAPGIEENAFGNGENDGHNIGKRSILGHDIAKQAAFRSAAARGQEVIDVDELFYPTLPPQFPVTLPPPPIVEVPDPGPIDPISVPPLLTTPWNYPPVVRSDDLPLRRAMPSALEREVRLLPALKFLPLSGMKDEAMKIISNALPYAHILPAIFPKPLARSSFARSQDFYRSELRNLRSTYSGLRSLPFRSYQTLPGPLTSDAIAMPLYKHVRNTARAQPGTEDNFRREVRSAVIKYLIQLWKKISKWFKPGSNSGGGTGGVLPVGEIPIEGGKEAGPGLPQESEVHTEPPPEEYVDDVIIEPVTPPVDDDGVEIIHLSSGEDSNGEGGSDVDEDYHEPIYSEPHADVYDTYWEARHPTRMGDDFVDVEDDTYIPSWYQPTSYPNWEARSARGRKDGSEDVARKIKDTSAGIRRKNMQDDLDNLTDIFGDG